MNKNLYSLYKKALYGVKAFPEIEIKHLHPEELRSIEYQNNRTWEILNEWKQELVTQYINNLFQSKFPNAPKTETLDILVAPVKNKDFKMKVSFKDLKISDEQVINKLISKGILPDM